MDTTFCSELLNTGSDHSPKRVCCYARGQIKLATASLCDFHPKTKPSNWEPVVKRWTRACQEKKILVYIALDQDLVLPRHHA